jgi:phosphate-selective porin OprO/OprP
MKHFKRTALASLINLALFGMPDAHADTASLERRIRELEARLEKLDQAGALAAKPAPVVATAEVEKLSRKVNTLERKLEVQDEVTAGAFQKLPVFDAGADGFKITSSDKKHQVRIRGAVQTDGRFFIDDNKFTATDRFELKQARVWLEGYFFKDIYFKIMPDFAATNILPDAYLDYAYHPAASLLVGKYKSPLSLERLQGDSDTVFLERAFPTYLASNRDVGIQLHGAFSKPGFKTETVAGPIDAKNTLTYQIGVTNGSGDDGSLDKNSAGTADNKEINGRLFAHPFQHTGYSWLEGLGLGVAGSVGNPDKQALNNQSTPLGRSKYLDYASTYKDLSSSDSKALYAAPTSDGATSRIYPQAYWYSGPFGAMGEYVVSTQHLAGTSGVGSTAKNTKSVNVKQENTAWQIQASYVVTGEDNTFAGVKPIRNFDPLKGTWGALQFAARYSELDVDNSTFVILDPTKSVSKARAWTVGANWYLNSNALIRADYENVSFSGGAGTSKHLTDRPNEQIFATRFQLSF